MKESGDGWCRWRAALAGIGVLGTGISIGVAAANYTHLRAMRGHTQEMVQGQSQHLEISHQTLQVLERMARDKERRAVSEADRREAAAARAEVRRLRRRLQDAEAASKATVPPGPFAIFEELLRLK